MTDSLTAIRKITGLAVCANCGLSLAGTDVYVCEPCRRSFEWLAETETAERVRAEENDDAKSA